MNTNVYQYFKNMERRFAYSKENQKRLLEEYHVAYRIIDKNQDVREDVTDANVVFSNERFVIISVVPVDSSHTQE